MHQIDPAMQKCIDECLRCYSVCLGMAMHHCLEAGGKTAWRNACRPAAAAPRAAGKWRPSTPRFL
jgi:hypothetical protein